MNYHGYTSEQLAELPTRQLMSIRKGAYRQKACNGTGSVDELKADIAFNKAQSALLKNLKAVLITRENIPNKKESKQIRQQKAKGKI